MNQVKIENQRETTKGWEFDIDIIEGGTSTSHTVSIEKRYYEKLTGGEESPERLIKRAFEFLLERESKESILDRFSLNVIQRYFPEFEEEIKR